VEVWAIANQKGGVGKTTTAISFGGLLAERGRRVLLLDLDPHGSITSYFRYNPDNVSRSSYDIFHAGETIGSTDLLSYALKTPSANLSLIPASTALATVERQMHGQDGVGLKIKRALDKLRGEFDHVLIDTPPILGVLMINALAASSHLMIPVQTDFLAIKGLERMLRTLSMVNRARKKELRYTIIPTMYDRRTHASISSLRTLRDNHRQHLWHAMIPVDTGFREASREGVVPSAHSSHSRGVVAYKMLLDELLIENEDLPDEDARREARELSIQG
jgi:chromosome partitioning protein